jgi:hypothetical protein
MNRELIELIVLELMISFAGILASHSSKANCEIGSLSFVAQMRRDNKAQRSKNKDRL